MVHKGVQLPVSKDVEKLLLWREPKKSGLVVGAATLAYLVLSGSISLAWLFTTACLAIVCVCQCWSKAGPLLGRGGPPVPEILAKGISEEEAHKFAEEVRKPLNHVLAMVNNLLTGKDPRLSTLTIGGLSVAAWVFRYLSFPTLMYAVVIISFTVPKVYEANKEKVDAMVAKLQAKSKDMYSQFEEKVRAHVPAQKKTS